MKSLFGHKNIFAIAAALAAVTNFGCVSQAEERPIPPPVAEAALPANISADSPAAQVIKLVRSGVDVGVINSFILNTPEAFALDADAIIALNDAGVPTALINQMLDHDKKTSAAAVNAAAAAVQPPTPPPAPVAPPATPAPPVEKVVIVNQTAPPPAPVTVNYFNDTLAPYGSWVEVDGYGRCWRPTVVTYDSDWRPYCDRGRWVYTDCGWYWDSDYSWGATFHYGRWFHHARHGWCWYPDTEWAPSWVTFRSGGDYCGWAPLPPLAVFRPGAGFFYRGASVSVGFSFGLDADCFTFVGADRFCERRPRDFRADRNHATQIFNQTTVINNYGNHNTTIINNGIAVDRVGRGDRNPIRPVEVGSLPNAGRHGWRGENGGRDEHRDGGNNNNGRNVSNSNSNGNNSSGGRSQPGIENGNREGNRDGNRQHGSEGVANGGNSSNSRPAPGTPVTTPSIPARNGEQQAAVQNGNSEGKRNHGPAPVLRPQNDQRNNEHRNENGGQVVTAPVSHPTPSPVIQPAAPLPVRVETQNPQRVADNNRNEFQNRESQNRSRGARDESPVIRPATPSVNPVVRATPQIAPPRELPRVIPPTLNERAVRTDNNRQNENRQNEARQNRNVETPVISVPAVRSAPPVEQRQITAPVQRVEQRIEQRVEQRIQPREQRSEPVVRSVAPAPTPAPVVSQPRSSENNASRNAERSSERNSERRSDKNKDR